jgi:5-methyltetrahydropteroyltriglutamate--homocysteine methyltransferase
VRASSERVLTTHTGSLPRRRELAELLAARSAGEEVDGELLAQRVTADVAEVVRRQLDAGLDAISDGELGKAGFSVYVRDRLAGFDGEEGVRFMPLDLFDYPGFGQRTLEDPSLRHVSVPSCTGPIAMTGMAAVQRQIADLQAALDGAGDVEAFMSCASPGVISLYFANEHYPDHERFVMAIAEAMREEYEAIAAAGFVVQVDCPDLAMGRHTQFGSASLDEFREHARVHVRALNAALAGISREQVRLHVCWGNYEGPHTRDVALADVLPILLEARAGALVLESCNPRHGHEWALFEEHGLPDGWLLVPGVIDTTTNYVEHPRLVAERIVRFAGVVGRERVIAGTDCGFGTFSGQARVHPKVAWAKLDALVEGARLASTHLF